MLKALSAMSDALRKLGVDPELPDDEYDKQLAQAAMRVLIPIIKNDLRDNELANISAGIIMGRLQRLEREREK